MKRSAPDLLPFVDGLPVLNLGAGKKLVEGTTPFDADRGWWVGDRLPFEDGTVGGAYAFHFMEHLTKTDILNLMDELTRVFAPGASLVAVTPHWSSEMAHQDIDHKSFWGETTWNNLLHEQYDGTMKRGYPFRIHVSLIMGVVQRNLVTVSQIVRTET